MSKAMTLRLPDAMHEVLRERAFKERTSITALVVQAIDQSATKPGTLCDMRSCWNIPTSITPGGFHWCDEHGRTS